MKALVTGASTGVGREFSRQLAARGMDLVLASRNREKLESLKTEVEASHGISAVVIPVDLSTPGSGATLFAECEKRGLEIDILINNAGQGMFGLSVDQEPATIEGLLTLNMIALTTLSSMFGARMREKGAGHILNIGSLAGNQATPYFASYSASKRYVHDFSLALRRELKSAGVKVTCLVPGFIKTNFDANAGIGNARYLSLSEQGALSPLLVAKTGLRAMFRGRARVTAGVANKVSAVIASLVPPRVKAALVYSGVKRIIR
jgi:uncharacterized protein